jgi:hypothetical protein
MKAMYKLIVMDWEEEIIPQCWMSSIMCQIFKKGDKLMCENFRGITLVSVSHKILSHVMTGRWKENVEHIFREYQCGFYS